MKTSDIRRRRSLVPVLALAATLAGAPAAVAQEAASAEDYETGWHIVRDGETLIHITRDYLGSKALWRKNWELNPDIEDPDVLSPGRRIRVLLAPADSVPTARVTDLSGDVEGKPSPLPWDDAQYEDLLVEKDGLRTLKASSTRLRFTDGTDLTVNEDSLIFLRRAERRLVGVSPKAVEIVLGQAEVAARGAAESQVDLEILVGGARSVPRVGADGIAQTRAKKASEGGAAFMVYEGEGEVEAGGAKVELPRGTGSTVPEGAPPSPPEPLLPAPAALSPADGSEWRFPDPLFSWQPVAGSVAYTLEICRDSACTLLVNRVVGIPETSWRIEPLPVARHFWRVNAVSQSGLDGYPSAATPFSVLDDRLDGEPPTGGLEVAGRSVTVGDRIYYDGSVRVDVDVSDAQAGVASWTARVDGESVAAASLAGPWSTGEHRVEASAVDHRGNVGELGAIEFTVDAAPPELVWQVQWVKSLLNRVRPAIATERWRKAKRRWVEWASEEFAGDAAGPAWLVVAWGDADHPPVASYDRAPFRREPQRATRAFEVRGDRPELFILTPPLELPGGEVIDDGRYLWLRARDEGAGVVAGLAARTERRPEGGFALVLELEDAVGNVQRVEWPFAGP